MSEESAGGCYPELQVTGATQEDACLVLPDFYVCNQFFCVCVFFVVFIFAVIVLFFFFLENTW